MRASKRSDVDNEIDVAIVGAGVSGAYCAWRLARANRGAIKLFECGSRVGGRLYSIVPNGLKTARAELGGMRFLSSQQFVMSLVKHLELETRPFPPTQERLFYLRGQRFGTEAWKSPERVPYFLEDQEQGKSPSELMSAALETLFPGWRAPLNQLSRLKSEAEYEGTKLFDTGLWYLMSRVLSREAFELIRNAQGNHTHLGNFNAAEMIPENLRHYIDKPEYLCLKEGYQSLPISLAKRFESAGGEVCFHHRLVVVEPIPSGGVHLVFETDEGSVSYRANQVILAIPQRALELLGSDCFLFRHQGFLDDFYSIVGQPSCKLLACYPRAWWRELGFRHGLSMTDLPVRRCFYMDCEADLEGGDPEDSHAILTASYADGSATEFWSGFRGRPAHLKTYRPLDIELDSTDSQIAELQRQLRLIHGPEIDIPLPDECYFADWSENPYGGGWHYWRIHARSWEVMPRIRHPIADVPVYICGEAWSHEQAWVQGALHTAEQVLEQKFELPRPSFLPAEYFLGD